MEDLDTLQLGTERSLEICLPLVRGSAKGGVEVATDLMLDAAVERLGDVSPIPERGLGTGGVGSPIRPNQDS